jgi:prepilin-type N-terminal cleavage/methylation domain-containing protein
MRTSVKLRDRRDLRHEPLTPSLFPSDGERVKSSISCQADPRPSQAGMAGFTLPEMMVTLAIFSMVVLAVVSVNLFGMRMIELTEPKMLADAESRSFFNTFLQDVRSANRVRVLDGAVPANRGNVLELELWFPTHWLTNYVRYELDARSTDLFRSEVRVQNGVASSEDYQLLASGISNSGVFTLEDPSGNLVTGQLGRMLVGISLQFSQLYPTGYAVGEEQRFKPYQLRTKVAFHYR